jgi:hypothetical protein
MGFKPVYPGEQPPRKPVSHRVPPVPQKPLAQDVQRCANRTCLNPVENPRRTRLCAECE